MARESTVVGNKVGFWPSNGLTSVLLPCLLLLTACGFHLRGGYKLPEVMSITYLQGVDRYTDLGVALQNILGNTGARLTTNRAEATAVLIVTKHEFERRLLGVDSAGKANEYELTYQVQFRVENAGGEILVAAQSLSLLRSYRFDPDNVLAATNEEARLKKEMARFAVRQMLHRIQASTQAKNR